MPNVQWAYSGAYIESSQAMELSLKNIKILEHQI